MQQTDDVIRVGFVPCIRARLPMIVVDANAADN